MNRFFLFLLAVLTLTACGKDADEPGRRGNQASERRELVSVRLSGDLELPYDDFGADGKALTLVPETRATGAVLTPTYEEGEQVEAVAYATSLDGTQSSGPLTLTLSVGEKGRKLFYHGDLSLPSSMVGSKIKFAVFVGFDPATGQLKAYPTTAPHYAKTGTRQTIENYPIALQAKAEVDYVTEVKGGVTTHSYRNLGLRFGLVGSLIRCALTNDTDQELTVTGLELHGLGATGLKLAKPTSGTTEEVFVTSDEIDPSTSFRTYTLPAPKKLVAGAKEEYYLVYAPLVSQSDGRGLEYKGYVRPLLSDPTLQADYADGQTAKALPSDRGGKLAVTSVVLEEKSPIQPNAIPLQYWNHNYYYKPGGVPSITDPNTFSLGTGVSHSDWSPFNWTNSSSQFDPRTMMFFPDELQPSDLQYIENASFHIPTAAELEGILPPEIIEPIPALSNLPLYYRWNGPYSTTKADRIDVAGEQFAGRSSIWRGDLGALPYNAMRVLFYQGGLSPQHPVYALRFGKLSDSEVASYKALGLKNREIARNNKSRVAYMYIFTQFGIQVSSCYIGANSAINTAQDLYTQQVFRDELTATKNLKFLYEGNTIYHRSLPYYGALYSTPDANSGAPQAPVTWNAAPSGTALSGVIPSEYPKEATITWPPSGLIRRKSRDNGTLEGVWFYRNDEPYFLPSSTPFYSWGYEDKPSNKRYHIKDLPAEPGRHFYYPIFLLRNTL